ERAVAHYLSTSHRDRPEDGCPVPAVVADLTYADHELRLALGRFFDRWADRLAPHAPETPHASARQRALATIALCVGGVTIARALRGQPLSDDFLRACETWALPERAPHRRERDAPADANHDQAGFLVGVKALLFRRPVRRLPIGRQTRRQHGEYQQQHTDVFHHHRRLYQRLRRHRAVAHHSGCAA